MRVNADVKMDLFNNGKGIEVGKATQKAGGGKAEAAATCESMARSGKLMTI